MGSFWAGVPKGRDRHHRPRVGTLEGERGIEYVRNYIPIGIGCTLVFIADLHMFTSSLTCHYKDGKHGGIAPAKHQRQQQVWCC